MARNLTGDIGNRTSAYAGDKTKQAAPQFVNIDDVEKVASTYYDIWNNYIKKLSDSEKKFLKQNAEQRKKIEESVLKAAQAAQQEKYNQMSLSEKQSEQQKIAQIEKQKQAELAAQAEIVKQTETDLQARQKKLAEIEEQQRKSSEAETAAIDEREKLYQKELKARLQGQDMLTRKRIQAEEEAKKAREEYERVIADDNSTDEDIKGAQKDLTKAEGKKDLTDAIKKLEKCIDSLIDGAMSYISEYSGKINARLQGTEKTYDDIMAVMQRTLTGSPYVQMKNVMSKVADLSDKGIAYNLELRAFLASISDNIASTFDAANGTLLRLIRLQQADTTGARLGMEAALTKFFGEMFEDTSYLSDVGSLIADTILDASSQLTREMSAEFEFAVDKWLGSLYSVGASSSFIASLAQGLNYLGTGNVSALVSNTQLQSLFAMAASRAGISYSDILTNGLSAETTNTLLASIVEYLQEIAGDTNQVVKSAYGGVFGFSLSDLRAIRNLTAADISNISGTTLTYEQATNELQNQIGQIPSRIPLASQLSNVWENLKWSMGLNIAQSPALYLTYKLADALEGAGGIPIPEIMAAGFGVGNLGTVAQWMKIGVTGVGLIGTLGEALASLSNGMGSDLSAFGYDEYTSRGKGFSGSSSLAVTQTTGQQTRYVGTGSSSDVTQSAKDMAMGESGAPEAITSGEYQNYRSVEDIFTTLIDPFGGEYIANGDIMLHKALRGEGVAGGLSLEVYDPSTALLAGAMNNDNTAVMVSNIDSDKNAVRYDEISVNTANTVIVLTAILSLLSDATGTTNPLSGLSSTSKTSIASAMRIMTGAEKGDVVSATSDLAQLITDGVRAGIVDASQNRIFNNGQLPT